MGRHRDCEDEDVADDQPDQPPPGDRPLGPGEPRSFANGRYVVRRRLGAGNFATVYLAHDERLDVAVAIKLLSDRWSWEPEARVRFVQEARMLRSLNDPYVVQIRDIAETEDGRPYLVMDYADRGTLEQRLSEHAQRGGPVVTADLRAVARALRDALQPLHARRIAHRDVKPSNLLLASLPPGQTSLATNLFRDDERLLLGDLGLAKDLTVGSGLTVGAGTAGYMAPEQSRPGTTIDTRTDIYAASALLAEVASGQPPDPLRRFRDGVLEGGSPLPANIVEPLRTVLTHGLDTDPLKRPATITEWWAAIDAATADTTPIAVLADVPRREIDTVPVHAGPLAAESPRVARTGAGRVPLRVALAALVVVVVAAVVLLARGGGDGEATASSSGATGGSGNGSGAAVNATSSTTSTSTSTSTSATVTTTIPPTTTAVPAPATTNRPPDLQTSPTTPPAPTPTQPPATQPPATTSPPTVPPAPAPSAQIIGPTQITRGVRASWAVDSQNAVSGTWSLTGSVQVSNPSWVPGNGFGGTWNTSEIFVLRLTVFNADGASSTASITVTVT